MKHLPFALLVTIATLTISSVAKAQVTDVDSSSDSSAGNLQTEPASVNQANDSGRTHANPYTRNDLNTASESLQANPKRPTNNSILPEKLLPPPVQPKPIDPIDFFKVPPLDGGVKLRVGS